MLKKNIFFAFLSGVSAIGIGLCSVAVSADMAQGDGDPDEVAAIAATEKKENSTDKTGALRADEQGETADNAVATVTADGDFLLPTYFLPGEVTATGTATAVGTNRISDETKTATNEGSAADAFLAQIAAAGFDTSDVGGKSAVPAPLTTARVSAEGTQSTTPVAPREAAPATDDADDLEALLAAAAAVPVVTDVSTHVEPSEPTPGVQGEIKKSKPLLVPLAPVTETVATAEPTLPPRIRAVAPSAYADDILAALDNGGKVPFRMPHEMKISFYPGESSFSGQSLKWVKAFAKTALLDPRLIVEIRASCQDAALQDKRLLLIQNALRGAGLSTHQIKVVFVERPVDTMLLRAIPRPEAGEIVSETDLKKSASKNRRVTKW